MSTPGNTAERVGPPRPHQRLILIAGIGDGWDTDPGTAAAALTRILGEQELPSGVTVHELGTGALDIAYDVMRAYDAVVLIDVTPGGGEVAEADETMIDATIEDGQDLDPHAMDAPTVLHFIKHTGGWPGRVLIVPCDADAGEAGAARAVEVALETIEELRRA
ncbi:MAG: hydrogenase maturation protease [Solirubrobacteraceae bacterium]|nr:hydrogenase maturation protease [Solirubrobacteraceae bacterium]